MKSVNDFSLQLIINKCIFKNYSYTDGWYSIKQYTI